jgi:WD40 repeat protein
LLGKLLVIGLFILLSACAPKKSFIKPAMDAHDVHNGGSQLAFNRRETLLASGGWEGKVALFDVRKKKFKRSWVAHTDQVNGLYFYGRFRPRLISAGYDGYLKKWKLSGKLVKKVHAGSPITSMAVSKRRRRLVTGHKNGSVKVWHLRSLRLLHSVRKHRRSVRAVAISDRTKKIASSAHDGRVYVWNEGRRPVRPLPRAPSDARSLIFDKKSRYLIGSGWFKLFRWQLKDRSLRVVKTEHRGIIKSIDLIKSSNLLATISRQTDSSVYLVHQKTGATVHRLQKHELCGSFIRVSPRGRWVATTSDDASVRIWNLREIIKKKAK